MYNRYTLLLFTTKFLKMIKINDVISEFSVVILPIVFAVLVGGECCLSFSFAFQCLSSLLISFSVQD